MTTKAPKRKQAELPDVGKPTAITFDQLDQLLALRREHEDLLRAKERFETLKYQTDDDALTAKISIEGKYGRCVGVRADAGESEQFMKRTIEARLTEVEAKMMALGITGSSANGRPMAAPTSTTKSHSEERQTMNATPHPLRGQATRLAALRDVLRPLDTSTMDTVILVRVCEDAVPDATVEDIITALRHTAAEHIAEADQAERAAS